MRETASSANVAVASRLSASELRPGMLIRNDDRIQKVLVVAKPDGGEIDVYLRTLGSEVVTNRPFEADEPIEVVVPRTARVAFERVTPTGLLFTDSNTGAETCIAASELGPKAEFLIPGMTAFIDTVDGRFCSLDLPEFVEVEVVDTLAPLHHEEEDGREKPAVLRNGFRVMVPMRVRTGDRIVLHFPTMRCVDAGSAPDVAGEPAAAGREHR